MEDSSLCLKWTLDKCRRYSDIPLDLTAQILQSNVWLEELSVDKMESSFVPLNVVDCSEIDDDVELSSIPLLLAFWSKYDLLPGAGMPTPAEAEANPSNDGEPKS